MKDPNLAISSDTICQLILCAREFQAKEGVTFPEEIPDSENEYDALQILADHKDDLTLQQASSIIEDLEPDQQIDLLALMYVGRGDFSVEEWEAARSEAKIHLVPNLSEYLFSKPQLPEYFEKGLELFGYSCGI